MDVKRVAQRVDKADTKRAIPFIQALKRKLDSGEAPDSVLGRTLVFNEVVVLQELVPILQTTTPRLRAVHIALTDGRHQSGETADAGGRAGGIPQIASSAEPGNPAIEFHNM